MYLCAGGSSYFILEGMGTREIKVFYVHYVAIQRSGWQVSMHPTSAH
jgi:hypothetical protein